MPRWAPVLVGIAVVAFAIWLVARDFHPTKGDGPSRAALDAEVDDGGGLLFAYRGRDRDDAGPSFAASLGVPGIAGDAGPGSLLPDGTPVPPLPLNAPRQLRFGVVLVSYVGAQPGANGERPSTRTRAEARDLAAKLAATAQHDFRAAVQQGDAGSADDIGTVKVGVLEPAPEYVLFTLPVDGVGGPVDTPRGYWIVKRLE
ncbi:MAG TPA: peptidylprolyl isomerase [Polyangiaceae bacterium]|nr:peptidylprolyl isomerase [Polyangiaceae bacterium]